jgi:gliding motility-associated-like protein
MKRISLSVMGFVLVVMANAQVPSFIYAKQIGGNSDDNAYSTSIDASGNVYTAGNFGSVVDFDPGAATFNLDPSAGALFISKLDASGNFVWAKQFGGPVTHPLVMTTDASGNVYATGFFSGTVDFDPGAGVTNLIELAGTGGDIYILKLDVSGNFVWAKSMGGSLADVANSIAVDALGNVYTTGIFNGTADFDPGTGIFNLNTTLYANVFVSKLDAAGNFVWAKNIDGTYNAIGNAIAVDASGNVYATGRFGGTADFDPGAGVSDLTAAGSSVTVFDVFILKLDVTGNFVWARNFGGIQEEDGYAIAADASGNVYTTGIFSGTVDFDPSASTFNLISVGKTNIFISKLDATGNFVWAKSFGGAGGAAYSLKLDPTGNVYATGIFSGTADFDPGIGTANLKGDVSNTADIFVSKLDNAGNYAWAVSVGGGGDDIAQSIAIDATGNLCVVGYFTGLADFNPGSGVFNLSGFFNDVFILKLGAAAAASISITKQPSASTVCSGTNSAFTTAATGTTNIIYQWQFSSTLTGTYNDITNGRGYSNVATASLSVNTTGSFGAGFYRCKVSGDLAATVLTNAAQLYFLTSGCNAPVIATVPLATQVEGKIVLNLVPLITTTGTLDVNSIKIITQPSSGALAKIVNGVLNIDYAGRLFSGAESIQIEACNINGACSQQVFSIEVSDTPPLNKIMVYNAVSPNGDKLNEFFRVENIQSLSTPNQVMIYNRWGDEVFSISDYDNNTRVFAGLTNGGSKLPSGTYFYKIILPIMGKTMTGFLSLKY